MDSISLTSLLREEEFRGVLNSAIPRPWTRSGEKLALEPTRGEGVDFGKVGVAYDYWVRYRIAVNKTDLYKSFIGYRIYEARYSARERYSRAFQEHKNVLEILSDEESVGDPKLMEACLFLASFEIGYRARSFVTKADPNAQDVSELKRVACATDFSLLCGSALELNPKFDLSGRRLHVLADGDLIVDGVLVDLKTGSRLELKDNLRQLIGYWALDALAPREAKVHSLAVYYPRFGLYRSSLIDDLLDHSAQERILRMFKRRIGPGIKVVEREIS